MSIYIIKGLETIPRAERSLLDLMKLQTNQLQPSSNGGYGIIFKFYFLGVSECVHQSAGTYLEIHFIETFDQNNDDGIVQIQIKLYHFY